MVVIKLTYFPEYKITESSLSKWRVNNEVGSFEFINNYEKRLKFKLINYKLQIFINLKNDGGKPILIKQINI